MADVYQTDNIGRSRAGDIKKTRDVTAVKKVTEKKSRQTLRERPSKKDRKGKNSGDDNKDHIDVYA